jgi:hypothetical protein
MTVEEKYIENMCKSFESSQLISEESGKGFHPTDTRLRVNEEEVTFTILNAIVVNAANRSHTSIVRFLFHLSLSAPAKMLIAT